MEQENPAPPTEAVPETPVAEAAPAPKAHRPKESWMATFLANKVLLGCAIGVAVLLVAGGAYALSTRTSDRKNGDTKVTETEEAHRSASPEEQGSQSTPNPSESLFLSQNGQNCVDRPVTFTSAPLATDKLGYLEPMGKVLDGHVTPTDHMYVHPNDPRAADNAFTAIMPADGVITNIAAMPSQYIGDTNQQTAADDHRITIMHSCRYFSILIHVHKLDPALTAVVGTLQPNTSKNVAIELKAGAAIGGIGPAGVDWTLVDTETRLTGFITPSLYEGESWKIHSIDPLSVYTGDTKTKLEALSMRSVAPFGGKIDLDKPGALVGNWFREGSGGYSGTNKDNGGRYWDGHLAIVPDYVDPSTTVVSIGNWSNDTASQFAVKGTADPAAVTTATGPVKYELIKLNYLTASGAGWSGNEPFAKGIRVSQSGAVAGTILFQVLDGEKLRVEKFVGKTAAQVTGFTSAAQTYYR